MIPKKHLLFAVLVSVWCWSGFSFQVAQQTQPPESNQFDFWLGKWDLTWKDSQGQDVKGNNHIRKILNERVVEENFSGGFEGKSYSVYDPSAKLWRQTWVNSNGGYLTLTGTFENGVMELRKAPFKNPAGKMQIMRMIFINITEDSFTWRWQRSIDDGATWTDAWVIQYQRAK